MKPEDCALSEVRSGQTLGLGTGRAAERFIRALGERVRAGLEIRGVPTSDATAKLAQELGIPLVDLDAAPALDLAVDGADEIDPDGNLIKGYGGALLREKVVASSAARFWVLAGAEKRVERLGQRGRLPVEVLPFAQTSVRRRLDALGLPSTVRSQGGRPVLSDNGNILLDCALAEPFDPHALERMLRAIPGLLDTGLFLGMADMIAIEGEGDTEVREVARVRP